MPRKFRFGVQTARVMDAAGFRDKVRRIEELGYSTLFMPDHFDDQLAPMPALMAAAMATETLRVGALVFDNDYKHPVVLAKEAATLDVLSGGRLELGIGAGWMASDYEQAGMTYDPPGVRISRLREAVRIIKGLFGDDPVDVSGEHYTVRMNGLPKPVQKPRPPILIGGGGKRVLRYAAREADIIGVNFQLTEGRVNRAVMQSGTPEATGEKIGWIREAAGARMDDIELNVTIFAAIVTDDAAGMAERLGPGFGVTPAEFPRAPHALCGSVPEIVDELERRRAEYGFSYVVISGDGYEAFAPVVKQLSGR